MSGVKKSAKAEPKPSARFTLEALRADCLKVLGIEQSTFDGVFANCKATDTLTVDEAKGRVSAWLKKPVKVGR